MTTVHQQADGQFLMTTKVHRMVLKRVTHYIDAQGVVQPWTMQSLLLDTNHGLAKQALRVLALAYKSLPSVPATVDPTIETDLIFAGLVKDD